MGESIATFGSRRLRLFTLAAIAAAAFIWFDLLYDLWLRDANFLSGWFLLVGMVFLALYNSRKKLPFLPLFRSANWLQLHLYIGLLVVVIFFVHTGLRFPQGGLEIALWLLFLVVALSGIVGILLSRALPNLIRERGERVTFERIPQHRAQLAQEVEDLAVQSVTELASNAIAKYYTTRLHEFFRQPCNFLAHLRGSREPHNKMREEINSIRRYLDAQGLETIGEIEERVMLKHDLDYQHAMQLVLKTWLFVHIPLSYALLVIALVHTVLVYAFSSGSL